MAKQEKTSVCVYLPSCLYLVATYGRRAMLILIHLYVYLYSSSLALNLFAVSLDNHFIQHIPYIYVSVNFLLFIIYLFIHFKPLLQLDFFSFKQCHLVLNKPSVYFLFPWRSCILQKDFLSLFFSLNILY